MTDEEAQAIADRATMTAIGQSVMMTEAQFFSFMQDRAQLRILLGQVYRFAVWARDAIPETAAGEWDEATLDALLCRVERMLAGKE